MDKNDDTPQFTTNTIRIPDLYTYQLQLTNMELPLVYNKVHPRKKEKRKREDNNF